ncbi:MAG: signal peptidase I [Deltaproteobacteria bacterium]|jgi:signal peptidase I|nr:signal peptidase I [Deltaproteobacteria bacterium]
MAAVFSGAPVSTSGAVAASKASEEASEAIGWQGLLWEYGKAILFAVALALVIRSFVVQAFHIPSGSMIPTFLEGDRVLVSKFSYGVRSPFSNRVLIDTGSPARGDVVIFKFPGDPKVDFVKRVMGLPGEEVELRDGILFVNGTQTPDPWGRYTGRSGLPSRNYGPARVPADQYFMMGDNRDFSNDSRAWGCVDRSLLRGKAWRLYWSWNSDPEVPFWKRLRGGRLLTLIQ